MGSTFMLSVLLGSLQLFGVAFSDSHSLYYYFTTSWRPPDGEPPKFQIVGFLDDEQIVKYDDHSQKTHLQYGWMQDVDSEHLAYLEGMAKHYEGRHKHTIKLLNPPLNDTNVYLYQVRFGCRWYDDNTTSGEEEFAAHGKDFIFLDNGKKRFMPAADEAVAITKEWNIRHKSVNRQFYFKDTACKEWLRNYLQLRNKNHPGNVRPEVKVWGRQHPDGVTRLQCLAYGFHPRAVDVKWVRNGEDHIPSDEASPILPHPDGTYQTRVSMEVPTREGDTYSCHVEHSSLEEPITMDLTALDFGDASWYSQLKGRSLHSRLFVLFAAAAVVLVPVTVYIKISGRKNKALTEPD
ncbi:zinc-alpha-2-glycoprotein-like [Hyperolius riggenbachi]|uniref:zinc-alpha-2-glycoprotein-like n=1 Tax=Hyperolius riggenbachi TaxID=752182 RepID=UPI0035A26EEF